MKYAIIVAGGSGSRISSDKPKQFLLLGNKPVLMHTLEKFNSAGKEIEIIVVIPQKEIDEWQNLCKQYQFQIPHQTIAGGETRFHSVKSGLQLVKEKSMVAVHDGVRPLVSIGLINRCFDKAEQHGNAVPCIPLAESIRKVVDTEVNEVADRSSMVIIQTPQCFDSEVLKKAYAAEFKDIFTDDASVVEFSGHPIHLIEGERVNIKITYSADLGIAEVLLKEL
jgi:2-C-methyl-D-erythritol 4-phosphate cytidylyltransferase